MNKNKKTNDKVADRKTKTEDDNIFWMSPNRLVALTDGVFAITMTLLVLELHTETLWEFDEWIEFYSYALGFFSLGVYWILHHYIFHFVKRSTGGLIWLNIIFLAASSMVPFWTRVINLGSDAPHPHPDFLTFFFGAHIVFFNLILLALWKFATTDKYLVGRKFNSRIVPAFTKVIIIGSVLVAIAAVGSIFIPAIGYLLFIAAAFFLVTTVYGPHKIFS